MAKQIVNKEGIVIPEGTMEDFQRSDHPDFATSAELKEKKFSGMRHNAVSDDCEIWILGNLERSISKEMVRIDGHAIDKAMAEIFALENVDVLPNMPALQKIRK